MYQRKLAFGVNIFNTRTKLTSMNVGSIEITLTVPLRALINREVKIR